MDDHISLLSSMLRSRYFEEALEQLASKGLIYGTYHLSIGQEAVSSGLVSALHDGDWIVPTHRCHGYNVARGSSLFSMFSEILGSRHGLCKGLGGSMHMTDTENCNLGSSAVVGSGIGLAGGVAFALQKLKKENIAVAIFGDGASSRGILYEVMNAASIWHLPILFLLENNHYGMSASADSMIAADGIYKRAEGFLIPSRKIDGNDVLSVEEAVREARYHILSRHTPYFIEAETYRFCGHSRSDKLVYRSREEEEKWKRKDPVTLFSDFLLLSSLATEDELEKLKNDIKKEVEEALNKALLVKDEKLTLREMEKLVYAPHPESVSENGKTHRGTYRTAIREALDEILASDSKAYLMGEDIGVYGGCFGVTGELCRKYPEKIIETPVSEEGFSSMATGAAMLSLHPIVEVMYGDFSTLVSDALINHAAKAHFMSGGQLSCPLVLRAPIGGMTGHGPQHTQCLETMFLGIPGLKVVAPSDAYSAKALLKAADRDGNPVLFFEHKALYGEEGEIGDERTYLPLGKAIVHGSGHDLLVIGYSRPFALALKALAHLSERITFLDLATLQPLDKETILNEFSRIGKALIVQDTPLGGSVAESVLSILSLSDVYKPGSVSILPSMPLPLPCPRELEELVLTGAEEIRDAAEHLLSL